MGLFTGILTSDNSEDHSPFIRACLQPLATDAPEPIDPIADAAAALLNRALEVADSDPAANLDLLYRSAHLGLLPAISMLGAELWVRAVSGQFPAVEGEERALEALGWLQHASDLGDERADDFLCGVLSKLPDAMFNRYLALPAHFPFVVN